MIDPIIIEPQFQKASGDCAVCCLRMLLGVEYTTVMAVIPKRVKVSINGLTVRQMRGVARRLGADVRFRLRAPDDDEIGIISLEKPNDDEGHVAMFLYGMVFDTSSGLIYTDLGAYLLASGWEVAGFLWREK